MKLRLQTYWHGRGEPKIEIVLQGDRGDRIAAGFENADDARAWIAASYYDDQIESIEDAA